MLFIAILLPTSIAYSICSPNDKIYSNFTIPLLPTATKSITIADKMVPVTVQGTISLVDGCSFAVKDFAFSGPPTAAWYGIKSTAPAEGGVRISPETLSGDKAPLSQTFKFVTTAGASISFRDFDTFQLYDPITQNLIGTAPIVPGSNTTIPITPGTTGKPSTPVASATPAPATTTTKSDAVSVSSLSALFLSLVSFLV
ncbi:hypothetical protein BC833DRAFT_600706 [Globomyces pollinis-pini]|nr:hypothetical protein BC833DRAFT_600706 [Globomyces pollinis-pini]